MFWALVVGLTEGGELLISNLGKPTKDRNTAKTRRGRAGGGGGEEGHRGL